MANTCTGTLRAVTKAEGAARRLNRLYRIINRQDGGYYLYRSDAFPPDPPVRVDGGDLVYQDLTVMGAWAFENWVFRGDHPETSLVTVSGDLASAHLTDLRTVCRELGIGVELRGYEPGCELCELYTVSRDGEVVNSERGRYIPDDEESGTEEWSEISMLDFSPVEMIYYGKESANGV